MQRKSSATNLLAYKREILGANGTTLTPPANFTPLTKIVATLGPATQTYETISRIIEAGVNVIRMNFSHGTHEFHKEIYNTVRKVASDLGTEVAIICDLQGPKVRCNCFPDGGIELKRGEKVSVVHSAEDGKPGLITTKFQAMIEHCKVGEPVLFDDGLLRAVVVERKPNELVLLVEQGGTLKNRKGINLPSTDLGPLPALTEKDRDDAIFVLRELEADFFALSFVRKPEDVHDLRKVIEAEGKDTRIIAKIEKPQAIQCLDDIITIVDGVMVARGDLAVEVGPAKVPCLQKHIIRHCLEFGVPVITATQMLESMTHNVTPTRAEATDVANAIFDGTDCVMLSGETAAGEFPVETVNTMQQIILETEFNIRDGHATQFKSRLFNPLHQKDSSGKTAGFQVGLAAHLLAENTDAAAFGCVSDSGNSAIRLSTSRPSIPIYVFSTSLQTVRRMSLTRGTYGVILSSIPSAEDVFGQMEKRLKRLGVVKTGDNVVYTAGLPTLEHATTNTVHVKTVE
ncbi:Pyruvate kinase [Blattamonas nauphoetae]|uniref:Pyruvate kinase n=1 Tax=Blattamonas nauphoetae TaxID=2049346 RepID=A0ABQ9YLJ2_9EUKA|nr:Pyruvate kinase [Blattamonas nauphoetae]